MKRGDMFVLSWESLRRVEWGKVSSFLSMSGGGLFNSLLMGLLFRWSELLWCEWFHVSFYCVLIYCMCWVWVYV